MKKIVLLTGAAGAVGLETLEELIRRKDQYTVRVIEVRNRRTERTLRPFRQEAEICWVDLTDRGAVEACVQDVDRVIHLAAIIPPLADRQPALAERVNVRGTQNLIEALRQNAPEAFLLYSSSVSVYGDRVRNPWIKVTDLLRPSEGDYYAVTKIKAEQLIRNSGLPWSIFRLTGIFNPQQKLDPLFFHMPLETCIEMATTRDTGYALVQALEHGAELQGRTFNLGGGEKCRVIYRDLLEGCFAITGLGAMDFPPEAFADHNFHCGYFLDSAELEQILHFQRDSFEDYLNWYAHYVPALRRWLARVLQRTIKHYLLGQSDPYRAWRRRDRKLMQRFFRQVKLAPGTASIR
ncbi:3 beta-hydroxysteroid dehydrogenase/Delta 5--_4-isomerase [Thermoflexales bacterium]|nr:3 beta-hydroxysteroid dehydrogenase/Delta 5-->4-isomerase [Thermoflexales bacterium]